MGWQDIKHRIALAAGLGLAAAGAAQAAGKPDRRLLETKFHLMYTGLRAPEMSRATGNLLHSESSRDIRAIPGVLRYTQSFPLSLYDLRSSYDAVTEFYADDLAAMVAAFDTPAGRASVPWLARYTGGAMGAGSRDWRPVSRGPVILKDHVLVDGHELGCKWFNFMRRKPGVGKAAADDYMRRTYGPALARSSGVRRYVLGLTYTPPGAAGVWAAPQVWDAVDMVWFANLADLGEFLGSARYQDGVLRAAEAAVVDQTASVSFAAEHHERVPFPPRYEGPRFEDIATPTGG